MISKIIDPAAMPARALLTAAAVRSAAHRVLALAREQQLDEWRLEAGRLPIAADFVAAVIRERYPSLEIPLHARWRHFVFEGRNLWHEWVNTVAWESPAVRARAEFDLIITSVLLDAGAGGHWSYRDPISGVIAGRSEGLALASLRWFTAGGLSMHGDQPLRADAAVLQALEAAAVNRAFQASNNNVLTGVAGRASLLNRLGAAVQARPELFGLADTPRPGGLFDAIVQRASEGRLPAATLLELVLEALGSIWHGRPSLHGVPLGDCWPYPPFGTDGIAHFVPLHKLSQWLAYSLVESLEAAGIIVTDLDALTGLAEYRNGGLFVDLEVLVPRDPILFTCTHAVADPFVVGWRALTVALLDELAPLVRTRLGLTAHDFPLGKLLEGGSWAAGRQLARARRADGAPPFHIISDGTVF